MSVIMEASKNNHSRDLRSEGLSQKAQRWGIPIWHQPRIAAQNMQNIQAYQKIRSRIVITKGGSYVVAEYAGVNTAGSNNIADACETITIQAASMEDSCATGAGRKGSRRSINEANAHQNQSHYVPTQKHSRVKQLIPQSFLIPHTKIKYTLEAIYPSKKESSPRTQGFIRTTEQRLYCRSLRQLTTKNQREKAVDPHTRDAE